MPKPLDCGGPNVMPPDSLPALLGGRPACPSGPPDWPPFDESVRDALLSAWQTGAWGKYRGGLVQKFEERLGEMHGVPHVLACGSGTYAVELALRALKVGSGDEVVLSAYDYFGNFLSVHAVHALPVLVDVDPDNWNLAPTHLLSALGPKTRAVIVSHLHGGIVPMREVMEIAAAHGVSVIEDAAQAPGARVQGRSAGTWGDVGILSFGGSKLLTAGRGGALLTRRADVFQRARLRQTRGGNVLHPLSELQAAVLLPQLERLAERNDRRRRSVERLADLLPDAPGLRLFRNSVTESDAGYYKVGFQYDPEAAGLSRERFLAAVSAEGVAMDEGFQALHVGRSPSRFRSPGTFREAERAHGGTVVLHHPVLLGTDEEIEQVALAIRKVRQHRWS
jgi:perosamine synthetase